MIADLALMLQVAIVPVAPPPIPATTMPPAKTALPPQDWSNLPILRVRQPTTMLANTSAYVHGEVLAGRCTKAVRTVQGWTLTVDLAVLTTPEGRVRRVTPRAIDCPTVEQYAAGVILGLARDSIYASDAKSVVWYRTSLTFAWGA